MLLIRCWHEEGTENDYSDDYLVLSPDDCRIAIGRIMSDLTGGRRAGASFGERNSINRTALGHIFYLDGSFMIAIQRGAHSIVRLYSFSSDDVETAAKFVWRTYAREGVSDD